MLKKNIFIAIFIVLLLLSSCGSSAGPWAMRLEYNGRTSEFSTNVYNYYLSNTKTRWLIDFINMFVPGTGVEQMQDLSYLWEEDEFDAEVKAEAEITMKRMLAIVAYCKEHNLALTAEQRNNIDLYIREIIKEVFGGSKSNFVNTMARFGINEEIFREIKRYEVMTGLVHRHLFDEETGRRPAKYEDMLAVYEDNFVRFKWIVIMTESSERDVEGELIKYTEEQLAEIRAGAQDIYNQIIESGNDAELFDRLMASHSVDQMIPDGFTISESNGLDERLTRVLLEMEINGVRMVELDGSIHIMQKYELLPPEETPDLNSLTSGNPVSVLQILTRSFQQVLLFDELTPYIDNIVINTEETDKFNIRTSDTMFDIWNWLE